MILLYLQNLLTRLSTADGQLPVNVNCLNIICYKSLEGCDANPSFTAPDIGTFKTRILHWRNTELH
jgi:hypothetical protein